MTQGHGGSLTGMTHPDVATVAIHWVKLAKTFLVPHTEVEYQGLIAFLDRLGDAVGEDEAHALASLMELVGVLIERYEDEHIPEFTSKAGS
jgi:HTH-type transcriptional regulator/antitoxin HigA